MLAPLLAALQAATWTAAPVSPHVGDTVVIVRVVAAPPRASVRADLLPATDDVVPLGPPQVIPRTDGALIRYRVALFRTGPVVVRLPAVQLLHPETGADALPADSVVVHVASVLPPGTPLDSVAPRVSAPPIARRWLRPARLVLPMGAALALIGLWVTWRRRPRRRWAPRPHIDEAPVEPTARWLGAGEVRVSAGWGIARLRQASRPHVPDAHDALDLRTWRAVIGVHRPQWPLRKLDEVMDRLDRARFAPLGSTDVEELLVEVEELVDTMTQGRGDNGTGDVGDGGDGG